MSVRSLLLLALAALLLGLALAEYKEPKKAGVFLTDFLCKLDPRINATTLTSFRNGTYIKQIKRYLWATACGRSRGSEAPLPHFCFILSYFPSIYFAPESHWSSQRPFISPSPLAPPFPAPSQSPDDPIFSLFRSRPILFCLS